MLNFDSDDLFLGSVELSYSLFKELGCISVALYPTMDLLSRMDEDKMRCLILDCLVALRRVQKQKKIEKMNRWNEFTKNRIFLSAVSIIIDDKVSIDTDQHIITSLLSSFPDKRKMSDGRNWLPLHFAVALGDKVSEEDVHVLYSVDPLALRQYSQKSVEFPGTSTAIQQCDAGFTPGHLLCMRSDPNVSLIRYLSMRDLKAFSIVLVDAGRNALHLAAQYSGNVEILKILLQIDHSMTKSGFLYNNSRHPVTSLGVLCERSRHRFPSFNEMLECLLTADSCDDVVEDSLAKCFESLKGFTYQDIEAALSFVEMILKAIDDRNLLSIEMLSTALISICTHLKGEFCIAVLSHLFDKYSLKAVAALEVPDYDGRYPIHVAAKHSTLDVLQFFLRKFPELLLAESEDRENLLHMALNDCNKDRGPVYAKVQFLCDTCPDLLHTRYCEGYTPFQSGCSKNLTDLNNLKIMYEADNSVVSDRCEMEDEDDDDYGLLPIELLCKYLPYGTADSEVLPIFCYLLSLCQEGCDYIDTERLYNWAVRRQESDSIMRLILNSDRTFQPEMRRDLNHKARKGGLFLAFRALSTDLEPNIWIKLRHESIDLLMHTISFL